MSSKASGAGPETASRTPGTGVLVLILLGVAGLNLLFGLGVRDLWDIDEGMHAATSLDMVRSGDWITPTWNGEVFYDKPALFNWFSALSILALGETALAARLPAALLGLAGVLVTFQIGRRLFNPRVGVMAGAILATSAEFMVLSRAVVHDISLAFFITLAMLCFVAAWQDERRRALHMYAFYAAVGFAVLAKGPVGGVIPGLTIGAFLVLRRRLGFIKEMRLFTGTLVFLLVAAPWYVLISLRNDDFLPYFYQLNFGSFADSEFRETQPIWYYVPILLGGFFPWTCFLPMALLHALRRPWRNMSDGTLFCLLWFGLTFAFFSVASSKLASYILPLFPAIAMLTASVWNDLVEAPSRGLLRGFWQSTIPLLLIGVGGGVALAFVSLDDVTVETGLQAQHIYIVTGLGVAGVVVTTLLLARRRYVAYFSAIVVTVIACTMYFLAFMAADINNFRSCRVLALELDEILPEGEPMVFYRRVNDSAMFYTDRLGRELYTPKELREFLGSDERVYCVVEQKRMDKVEPLSDHYHVVRRLGNKLVISNRDDPS